MTCLSCRLPAARRSALALSLALLPTPLRADLCVWVAGSIAERAADIVRGSDERLDLDTGAPQRIGSVEVRHEGGNSSRVLLDGAAIDLAHLFVRSAGGEWRNLGWLLPGCLDENEPRTLRGEPFFAVSEDVEPPPPPAWIALAELPTVLKQWTDADPEPRPIAVFAEPSARAERVATLVAAGDLPTREWDYERAGAYVVEEWDDWLRIRLAGGSGWIRRADAGTVHPFAELARDGLAYLGPAWDGLLFETPEIRSKARRLDDDWRRRLLGVDEVPIEILELHTTGGALWLRVRVTSYPCTGEQVHSFGEGWVPYAGKNGEPSIGFWSRGC